ncbi:YcxB family protein [Luteolibacter flavescens]|uniref:YcxB family protein n=1 Tax=Luteolibacter flavescens TaxID=1859460 RepID=A0ABT3FUX4_9BACT|nr:YcxB family protein [Luteolibacter flavescens]MCW1887386.1 YcxB family protein [Luteolibacter flavescens]
MSDRDPAKATTMRFTYQPNFSDYLALNRHVLWAQLKIAMLVMGVLTLVALVYPFVVRHLASAGNPDAQLEFGLIHIGIPLLALLFAIAIRVSIRKRWDKIDALRATLEYDFDEQGLATRSDRRRNFTEWPQFAHATVTKKHFILKTHAGSYYYFPLSVIPDRARLLALLEGKVPVKGG